MIKTPVRRRLEIRGRARHAEDYEAWRGFDDGSSFNTLACARSASGGEIQTPGRLAFAAIYRIFSLSGLPTFCTYSD